MVIWVDILATSDQFSIQNLLDIARLHNNVPRAQMTMLTRWCSDTRISTSTHLALGQYISNLPCSDEKQRLWKWKIMWPPSLARGRGKLKGLCKFPLTRWRNVQIWATQRVGSLGQLTTSKGASGSSLTARNWTQLHMVGWFFLSPPLHARFCLVTRQGKNGVTVHSLFNHKKLGRMFTRHFSMSLAWLDRKCEPMAAFFSPQKTAILSHHCHHEKWREKMHRTLQNFLDIHHAITSPTFSHPPIQGVTPWLNSAYHDQTLI